MRPLEERAVRVDAYLDELLAIRGTRGPGALSEPIEPELEAVASLAMRAFARFHPSFRFEERLADRLALEAVGDLPPTAGHDRVPATVLELRGRAARGGILLGGAIASGVSIAGAALIARARRRADQRWQELG